MFSDTFMVTDEMVDLRAQRIQHTLNLALLGNIASVIIKLLFGLLANSLTMIADALHSVFDSFSSIIGIYGNKLSNKPPDISHPYGHGKFEYTAALGITIMMFVASFGIIREAIGRVIEGIVPEITVLSFGSMLVSMLISISIAWYERAIGRQTSSAILLADSSHSLSDVLASIAVLSGFVGINLGINHADSYAALIVCLIIGYIAFSIFMEVTNALVDRGVSLDILSKVKYIAEGLYDDITCHNVRGRRIGNKVFLDMHLSVGGELSVERGHIIAEHITNKLKECIEGLEDVLVHVEPEGVSCDETKSSKKVVRIMNLDEDSSASKGMTTK